jgi:L-arabinonolactonase
MHSPDKRKTRRWDLPDRLGCLALQSGRLLLGLANDLFLADLDVDSDDAPRLSPLTPVEIHERRTRINDGRVDRAGNFVFGTLNEDVAKHPIGSFYQYSAPGLQRLKLGDVAIPNGVCFSRDGRTMYYCDSMPPRILCCDYDAETAHTSQCRIFAEVCVAGSCADGSTIDAEGCLWNAQWGAARVVRYTPKGAIDRVVYVPAKNPSCVALGGTMLDQLYITTARLDINADELEELPETQLVGLMGRLDAQRHVVCLPGTHSKWAMVKDGRVESFITAMTGELFELLCKHSLLGRLMTERGDTIDPSACEQGIVRAREPGGLLHHLFSVRTSGLLGTLEPRQLASYLSGLLIAHEVLDSACGGDRRGQLVHLVGSPALLEPYSFVLRKLGITLGLHDEALLAAGAHQLTMQLGRVQTSAEARQS